MDSETKKLWRLVRRQTRDAVHECTTALKVSDDTYMDLHEEEAVALFAKLPRLRHLDLRRVGHDILHWLGPGGLPTRLVSLTLEIPHSPNVSLALLSALQSLHTLSLTADRLPSEGLTPLAACDALATLSLRLSAGVTDVAPSWAPLAVCRALDTLHLDLDVQGKAISLDALAPCPCLRTLIVRMHYPSPLNLPTLPATLRTLKLEFCNVPDSLACLSSCRSLRALELVQCQGLEDLPALAACPELTVLHIKGCQDFDDTSNLARCPALCDVNLAGSWGITLNPLKACASLRTLTLSSFHASDVRRVFATVAADARPQVTFCDSFDPPHEGTEELGMFEEEWGEEESGPSDDPYEHGYAEVWDDSGSS